MEDSVVYSKLYDIVAENMEQDQIEMEFTKEAYLFQALNVGNKVDLLKMIDMDNESFFETAYLCLLGRFPDEKAVESWRGKIKGLGKEEFQRILINTIMNSLEFKIKNVEVHNCIYGAEKFNYSATNEHVVTKVKGKFYLFAYKVYKRFPLGLRLVIRKMAGRD